MLVKTEAHEANEGLWHDYLQEAQYQKGYQLESAHMMKWYYFYFVPIYGGL